LGQRDALDLCDVLGSYVPGAKVRLDNVSKILGLSGKPVGIDGSRVEEMALAGQIEEVARYCKTDEYLAAPQQNSDQTCSPNDVNYCVVVHGICSTLLGCSVVAAVLPELGLCATDCFSDTVCIVV
jgi:hypothetical protein